MTFNECGFPDCEDAPVTATGMCDLHRKVTVSTSWVDDRHLDGGHG